MTGRMAETNTLGGGFTPDAKGHAAWIANTMAMFDALMVVSDGSSAAFVEAVVSNPGHCDVAAKLAASLWFHLNSGGEIHLEIGGQHPGEIKFVERE